jgi:hypothetical protein
VKPNSRSHVWSLFSTVILLCLAFLALENRQLIVDQINVWQYVPSAEVQALADNSGMSDKGEYYLYTSRPAVLERSKFNAKCNDHPENISTAILGCYTAQRIYVYNVTDTRLTGITSVTAAHEMLHAVYERLSKSERTRVNTLLEAEYIKLKDNKSLVDRMAFYDKTEPGERDNELHSVIGTEIGTISSELETYYKSYFADRNRAVVLHGKYESVFSELQTKADQLSAQLVALNAKIDSDSKQYNNESAQLDNDIKAFNAKASTDGGFSTQSEFNAVRTTLLARSNALNAFRNSINNDIVSYESLRQQLAAISNQSDALNRSINSSLAPAISL